MSALDGSGTVFPKTHHPSPTLRYTVPVALPYICSLLARKVPMTWYDGLMNCMILQTLGEDGDKMLSFI